MKNLFRLLLLTLVLSNVSTTYAQLDSNYKAKLYFTEAETQFNQNNFKVALEYIQKTEAELGSTNGRILNLKVKTLYSDGQFAKAQKVLEQFSQYEDQVTDELKNDTYSYFVKIERYLDKENARKITTKRSGETLIDSRDGKRYETVIIGNQTWMAENLNYAVSGSYCYDNSSSNCEKYGRLYNWYLAQKVCPDGWHLPSEAEWKELEETVMIGFKCPYERVGHYLKSSYDWPDQQKGYDSYGFSGLPAGWKNNDTYGEMYEFCFFWTSSIGDSKYDWNRTYALISHYLGCSELDGDEIKVSVRCVKD
jgi:uncharacterized protein (TIGR02145 family)